MMTNYPECGTPATFRTRPSFPTTYPCLVVFPGLASDNLQDGNKTFFAFAKEDWGSKITEAALADIVDIILAAFHRNDHVLIINDLDLAAALLKRDDDIDLRFVVPEDVDQHRRAVLLKNGWHVVQAEDGSERVAFDPREQDIDGKLAFINAMDDMVQKWKDVGFELNCPVYTCADLEQLLPLLFPAATLRMGCQ